MREQRGNTGAANDYVPLATADPPAENDSDSLDAEEPGTARPSYLPRAAVDSARRCVEIFNNNTGLLLIALSQGFASLMGVYVKKLNELDPPVHPLELIWIRMVMTWAACVAYMYMTNVPDPVLGPKGIRLLLVLRGLSGFVGLFGTYYALQYLSLSDTTVLSFLTPMCTAIAGALLLKEDLTVKQVLASLFSFAGVVLIARPEFLFGRQVQDAPNNDDSVQRAAVTSTQRLVAVGVALLGVVGLTSAYTTIRAIGKRAHAMHNLGAFSLLCIVTAPIAMVITGTKAIIPDNLPCIAMILAVSGCGFAAQMTMTSGLQRETAGRGTMAIYVQVIFALIFERIFFHTTPPPLSIVGTVIILSSAIYIAFSKQNVAQKSKIGDACSEGIPLEEGLLPPVAGLEGNQDGATSVSLEMAKFSITKEPLEKFNVGPVGLYNSQPGSSRVVTSRDGV